MPRARARTTAISLWAIRADEGDERVEAGVAELVLDGEVGVGGEAQAVGPGVALSLVEEMDGPVVAHEDLADEAEQQRRGPRADYGGRGKRLARGHASMLFSSSAPRNGGEELVEVGEERFWRVEHHVVLRAGHDDQLVTSDGAELLPVEELDGG